MVRNEILTNIIENSKFEHLLPPLFIYRLYQFNSKLLSINFIETMAENDVYTYCIKCIGNILYLYTLYVYAIYLSKYLK